MPERLGASISRPLTAPYHPEVASQQEINCSQITGQCREKAVSSTSI